DGRGFVSLGPNRTGRVSAGDASGPRSAAPRDGRRSRVSVGARGSGARARRTDSMRYRAALAIVIACLVCACHHNAPEETETATAVAVQVEPARSGPVREVIAASGLVTAAPGAELVVTAPEAARIVELPRAEGDRVKPGDLLVRFEIPSLTAGAASSKAAIEQALAHVENAKAAAARVQGLFERGVAARKEVEDAERELREATAALAQAQSASGAANALADRTVVRATFAGVVAKRMHNPGDLVEPGPGDP